MAEVVRALGYTNSVQRWVSSSVGTITAHLWGGGGGGGGWNAGNGGSGSGSGYASLTFLVAPGDVIDVAVGGPGGVGADHSSPGGSAGASYVEGLVFNSRSPPPGQPPVYPSTNGAYVSFLNRYGVWEQNQYEGSFNRTYTWVAPVSGQYQIISSCDNYGTVSIDGNLILNVDGFTTTYVTTFFASAGSHTVTTSGINTGGPGSMGTIIALVGPNTFSGAPGGDQGPIGRSGSGGGSGGATVLFKNGVVLAVAGGGGGGGGAGATSAQSAPGSAGRASPGINNGQAGGNNLTDGGGGGAGGGGWGGGNGGGPVYYDQGATAGSAGGNLGDVVAEPSGRQPGNSGSPYRYGSPGLGGVGSGANGTPPRGQNGTAGLATLVFDLTGVWVKESGVWTPVQETYIKTQGTWRSVQETYIKENGVWKIVSGTNSTAPEFNTITGNFGVDFRE